MQSNMHLSNIVNPSEGSFVSSQHHFELLPHSQIANMANIPILYIDIKISQDNISRLVLYKNQTPYEAAMDFIEKHNISIKLRPYLIEKVQDHYDKVCKQRYEIGAVKN